MDFILAFALITYLVVCVFVLSQWDRMMREGVPAWALLALCILSPLSFFLILYYIWIGVEDEATKDH